MRASTIRLSIVIAFFLLCGCAQNLGKRDPSDTKLTVLISVDGLSQAYLDRVRPGVLADMIKTGARANGLRPVFPTKTFPNHYTQVTGLYPANHGIVGNKMFDSGTRDRFSMYVLDDVQNGRWWWGEPIWVTAQRQGVPTGTSFWPGSEAHIPGGQPKHWIPFDAKFPPSRRVETALGWLELKPRPQLVVLYFEGVDVAGHVFGPDSPEIDIQLQRIDDHLKQLFDGLERLGLRKSANILLVSDHGMTSTESGGLVCLDEFTDVHDSTWAGGSPVLMLWPSNPHMVETLEKSRRNFTVYKKPELPKHWNVSDNPRIAPVIIVADEGWVVRESCPKDTQVKINQGEHGYDNALSSMLGVLIGHGPKFKSGFVGPEVGSVQIYELLCHLLGIEPAPNDGDFSTISSLLVDR